MSDRTGPITNRVRNNAMPVSTWLGGDDGRPRAFRVRPRTTMILVNEVQSSSTDGATESTVIARISVIELLGDPSPIEMSTLPSPGTTGAVGAVGATGSVGAAEAGPASSTVTTVHSSANSSTRAARRRVETAPGARTGRTDDVMTCGPCARAAG